MSHDKGPSGIIQLHVSVWSICSAGNKRSKLIPGVGDAGVVGDVGVFGGTGCCCDWCVCADLDVPGEVVGNDTSGLEDVGDLEEFDSDDDDEDDDDAAPFEVGSVNEGFLP